MWFVAEPRQDLVRDEDDRVATCRTRTGCRTLVGNWYVWLRFVVCRERGNVAVLAGKLKELSIWTGTDRICVVVNFVRSTLFGDRLGNLRSFCACQ